MDGKGFISFLLLTCFSVFLGHNLVPHHHHAEAVNVALDGDCPTNHEDHHDSEERPMHCHAFNGVDFVKYSHSIVKQPVRVISTLIVPVSKTVLEPPLIFESQRYICLIIPDKTSEFRGAISMRAPPVSA